jgi:hypothetical protein
MMGLKEFFTIKMVYFRPYPQYSSTPLFQHSMWVCQSMVSQNYVISINYRISEMLNYV